MASHRPDRHVLMAAVAVVVALLLLSLGPLGASAEAYGVVTTRPRVVQLSNGFRIVVCEQPWTTLVHVRLLEAVGPPEEPPGKEGIAHLLEHLMFTSSIGHPNGGLQAALALLSCYSNAETTPVTTAYTTICLPELLPEILRLEADRLRSLDPSIEELEREKSIVRDELAYRRTYSPQVDLQRAMFRALHSSQALGRNVAGTDSSVAAITLDDIHAFRRRYLTASRCVLVVAGRAIEDEVVRLAGELFGVLPADEPEPRPSLIALSAAAVPHVVLDRYDLEGFQVAIGWCMPASTIEDRVRTLFLANLLESWGGRTRLMPGWQEDFLQVSASSEYMKPRRGEPRSFDPERDSQFALSSLWDHVSTHADTTFKPHVFERVRSQVREQLQQLVGDAEWWIDEAGRAAFSGTKSYTPADLDSMVAGLTSAGMRAYFQRQILDRRPIHGVVHGRDSRRAHRFPRTQRLERREEVLGGDPGVVLDSARVLDVLQLYAASSRPRAEQFALRNGIRVTTVSIPGAPRVHLAGVKTCPWLDAERRGELPGLSLLYNFLVRAGSDDKSRTQEVTGDVVFVASACSYEFSASCLPNRTQEVAGRVARRLQDRDFDTGTWRAILAGADDYFDRRRDSPQMRARSNRWAVLLGADHPAIVSLRGSSDTAAKMKYKDVVDLHSQLAATGNLQLLAAGDLSTMDLQPTLEAAFGGRPETKLPRWEAVPVTTLQTPKGFAFPAIDEMDCTLTVTMPPIPWVEAEHLTWVGCRLLEECLTAELYTRLQMTSGLVYVVRCRLTRQAQFGMLEIETSCLPKDGPRVYSLLRQDLARLSTSGIRPSTLGRAKLALSGQLARQLEVPYRAIDVLVAGARHSRPTTDPLAELQNIGLETVNACIERWIRPNAFAFSVTGPLLEEDIEQYEFGAVQPTAR